MKRTYQVVTKPSTLSSRELAEFLSKDGQLLLPLVELLERGEKAIDEVIDVMGRATVEAVLRMSAEQLAGPKRQGRRADDRALYWHGSQPGRVTLSERQLRVEKPRLRKKTARQGERGEVAIPAYDAMQRDQRLADRMLAIMLNGVSTRRYETVLPAMAEQVGIGKSEVSRETIEAGTRVLQDLAERDFSKVDVLIIYLDGIQFGNHHVLAAVGVDEDGKKYVLGVRSGASENATVTTALLEDLVARGIRPDRRRLFVVDGAKALRSAIAQVFGAGNEVQRCRNHKLRNVSSATCRTRSTTRHGPPCAPPGSSRLRRACASLTSTPRGSNATGPMQQRAFEKASMRSSPWIGSACPHHCARASRRRTSSIRRTRESGSAHVASPTGRTERWRCAGRPWPSWRRRRTTDASQVASISGC